MTATAPRTVSAAAGFATLDLETRIDSLPVQGDIPAWLTGSLVRPGPAKFEAGDQQLRHWFDGLAMLHRFSFGDGEVSYANRFLEGRSYRSVEETGRMTYPEFATDPCRSIFQRVQSLFSPEWGDNANINMVKLGERCLALTETPIAVEFDPDTLAAAGVGHKAPGMLTTAHPHLDRQTGDMLNYAARLGARNEYRFYAQAPGDAKPRILARRPVREPAYMHSFGLTENWFVLAEFPFVVNPLRLALSGKPYIENYRWKPERGTRFTLIERNGGRAFGPFAAEPCFAFHHVNAYEEDGDVVADVCVYADNKVIDDLYLDRLRAGTGGLPESRLRRFRISPHSGKVGERNISERNFELARINYRRCNERPYRYTWGVSTGDSGWIEQIVKIDVSTGADTTWQAPGCFPGEPVFVAAPHGAEEDAGVLLSVVLDGHTSRSFLLVLDAQTLAEHGRAEVPHHIPFGFHGQYVVGAT
jgi:carotenoid cleavage dioxygenase-like enzyme